IRKDYNEETLLFPICVGWQTTFIQNNKKFYMHITEGNELNEKQPGFRYNSGSKFSDIKEISSWGNKDLLNASLKGVEFRPFVFKVEKYLIQIINIRIESNLDLISAGIGYMSSFIGEDIEMAIKDIQGTTVTNIKPDQKNINKNKSKLPEISNWHQFKYLIETEIYKSMKEDNLNQPNPEVSTYTDPNS
ncbi:12872_t:CDS:2, partial [Gigaspora margarita]